MPRRAHTVVFSNARGVVLSRRTVELGEGETSLLDCGLTKARSPVAASASTDLPEVLGYVGLGSGAALGLASYFLYNWNKGRVDQRRADWQEVSQALSRPDLDSDQRAMLLTRAQAIEARGSAIRDAGIVTGGLGVLSGACVIAGITSLWFSDTFRVVTPDGKGASAEFVHRW